MLSAERRRRLTLLAMCIAQGMILLDITIVNVALPSIQHELHASSDSLEWVISAYALSMATLIPLSGTLGDRYGRKRLFTIGVAVFTAGSAGCALSPSATALIGARGVQGVGGAIMSALTLSILSETYPAEQRVRAIGIWATCASLGFGLGPVLGGVLLGFFGWASIFWVNMPFAVACIAITIVAVSESRDPSSRPVDIPGVIASALGLLSVTFALIESSAHPWSSWQVAAPLAAGVVLLAFFAWWERRAQSPMVPPALLRVRSFVASCGVYLFGYAALTGVLFYLTLLYQDVNGWSALRTGLSWLWLNLPFMVLAQFAGPLNRRIPAVVVVSVGCTAAGAGMFLLSTLTPATPFVTAAVGYALVGAGYGTAIPAVTGVAMRDVPTGFSGVASGILNASRQVGTSVGLAVLGSIGASVAAASWAGQTSHLPRSSRWTHDVASAQIAAIGRALGAAYRQVAAQSFTHGLHIALIAAGLLVLAAAATALLALRRRGEPRSARKQSSQVLGE